MREQEQFYAEANTGYLAWRLKTVQRTTYDGFRRRSRNDFQDSPTTQRETLLIGGQLFGEECREALSTIQHSTDQSVVITSSVLDVFQRFLDTPGLVRICIDYFILFEIFQNWILLNAKHTSLTCIWPLCFCLKIEQDFSMMFGAEVSGQFPAKWPSYFKDKVIAECQSLPRSLHVEELLAFDTEAENDFGKYGQFFCVKNTQIAKSSKTKLK